jgi:hypothetical protein
MIPNLNSWVTNQLSNSFKNLRASDGVQVLFCQGGLNQSSSIAFDGMNVWVSNVGDLTVSKF